MEKKKNSLTLIRIILGLTAWFLSFKLYAAYIAPLYADSIPVILQNVINSMLFPYTVALGLFYLIIKGMDKGVLENEKPSFKSMAGAFVIQSGLSFPAMAIINVISMLLGFGKQGLSMEQVSGNLGFYIVLLLVFNPIFEELVFRKIVLNRLLVLGKKPAIIWCAALFALPHLFSVGLAGMVNAFVCGLVWSYVTVKTGKLWPAIILHALGNVYGCFFPLLMQQTMPTTAIFMLIAVLIMPAIGVAQVVFELRRKD